MHWNFEIKGFEGQNEREIDVITILKKKENLS